MSAAAVEMELCTHVCPLAAVRKRKSASDLIASVTPKEACAGLAAGAPTISCLTLDLGSADQQSNDLNNNDELTAVGKL